MKKQVGAYLDIQNIYYTVKQEHKCHFNFKKYMDLLQKEGKLVFANAYATNKNDNNQKRFQSLLLSFGYQVKLIDYIQRKDGTAKADWDVGIAVDMTKDASDLDKIILVSGDGDFEHVIKHLKSTHEDLEIEVYGVPELTSSRLINSADRFTPINTEFLLSIPDRW